MEICTRKTNSPKQKPDESNLGFGSYFTDHMFLLTYEEGKGWHDAQLKPYEPFVLDPSAMVFHYAQECFEGLKAYRTPSGGVQLFRPERNAMRMAATHRRLCIPEVPVDDFVQAVKALVSLDASWVPSAPDTSLYIRPCTIAVDPKLGVHPSNTYYFFIICSPSGAYYAEGLNPVKIYVEDEMTRAAPGGMGEAKCGGNYAASLAGQVKAHELGYSQVLWLDGKERKYVEEVGSMNCFFIVDGEVLTASLDGTVLPGITRMSCIELLRDWGYTVTERQISIDELIQAGHEGRLQEVFGTGTAAVVSPVGGLRYRDEVLTVGDGSIGEVTARLYDTLTGIQWGRLPDEKGWTVQVD